MAAEVYIEPAGFAHALLVSQSLRPAAERELRDRGGEPLARLRRAIECSEWAHCIFFDDAPAALFGVASLPGVAGERHGNVWTVTTTAVDRHRKTFASTSRQLLRELLAQYVQLDGAIDARMDDTLRWARWLGFTVGEPRPVAFSSVPYCSITIRRA